MKSALPYAVLLATDIILQGIAGLVQESNANIEIKQCSLMRLNPKLQAPTSVKKQNALWNEILTTAQEYGLPKTSLLVIAALSAISAPQRSNPAKMMLKFKLSFTKKNAYNALADIRSLEILMHLFALHPFQPLTYCPADKNLALFWAGLAASDFRWAGDHLSFKVLPYALMPYITAAQRKSLLSKARKCRPSGGVSRSLVAVTSGQTITASLFLGR